VDLYLAIERSTASFSPPVDTFDCILYFVPAAIRKIAVLLFRAPAERNCNLQSCRLFMGNACHDHGYAGRTA